VTTETAPKEGKLTIILHSGAYDRVCYALWTAIAALSSGMEAYIFLSFEGAKRFTIGRINNLGYETPTHIQSDIEFGMEAGIVQPLDELIEQAKGMGLKIYVCPNALAIRKIPLKDMLGVDEIMGLVGFLAIAKTANISLFI